MHYGHPTHKSLLTVRVAAYIRKDTHSTRTGHLFLHAYLKYLSLVFKLGSSTLKRQDVALPASLSSYVCLTQHRRR